MKRGKSSLMSNMTRYAISCVYSSAINNLLAINQLSLVWCYMRRESGIQNSRLRSNVMRCSSYRDPVISGASILNSDTTLAILHQTTNPNRADSTDPLPIRQTRKASSRKADQVIPENHQNNRAAPKQRKTIQWPFCSKAGWMVIHLYFQEQANVSRGKSGRTHAPEGVRIETSSTLEDDASHDSATRVKTARMTRAQAGCTDDARTGGWRNWLMQERAGVLTHSQGRRINSETATAPSMMKTGRRQKTTGRPR